MTDRDDHPSEQGPGPISRNSARKRKAPNRNADFSVRNAAPKGAAYTLEIAEIVGAKKAYLKGESLACDKEGVTGETLRRAGLEVIRVS